MEPQNSGLVTMNLGLDIIAHMIVPHARDVRESSTRGDDHHQGGRQHLEGMTARLRDLVLGKGGGVDTSREVVLLQRILDCVGCLFAHSDKLDAGVDVQAPGEVEADFEHVKQIFGEKGWTVETRTDPHTVDGVIWRFTANAE